MCDKLREFPGFPPELRALVEHRVLGHSGQLEFGSPKLPSFPEALLLHYLDDMDSKMECMRALIENDRQVDGGFTTYTAALSRASMKKHRFLNPDRFLTPLPVVAAPAPPQSTAPQKPAVAPT